MIRVRYIGALFEFANQTFYVQRAAVSEDLCDRARREHSLTRLFSSNHYSLLICLYNCIMISQVTGMVHCDVVTIVCRC